MNAAGRLKNWRDLVWPSLKVGLLGFGGPAGQIALMHRVFVDEKKWIDEPRYLHALNYCMLLPGPEAQQLAVYVGRILDGVRGGVIAGLLFVAPGSVVILALSALYAAHADVPAVAAIFHGIKLAVLAVVAHALVKIGRRALKNRTDVAIAVVAFALLFVFGAPFPLIIFAAAAFGLLRRLAADAPAPAPAAASPRVDWRGTVAHALVWTAVWFAPLAVAAAFWGPEHVVTRVGVFFSKLAMVTFGGAYAVLAYMQQQAVDQEAWLSAGQMIDGLGLAETTPGPLVLVNEYVGFMAGWNVGGTIGLAVVCAAMAIWCTFAPSFLWIFVGAPYADRIRDNGFAAAALRSITAAVLGGIASLATWFALHVLFGRVAAVQPLPGVSFEAPVVASLDAPGALVAVAAGVALVRFKANLIAVIAACGAAGLGLSLIAF